MSASRQDNDNVARERGSALIMIIFTVFLVMLVVSAIFALSRQNFLSVNHDEYKDKAAYAAKAGLEHAIAKLADDINVGSVATHGEEGETFPDIELETDPDITYTIQMINNDLPFDPDDPNLVDAPDGLKIPPRVVWVKSTGKLRDRSNTSSSSLIKLVGYQRPILKQALFGINFVEISGNSVVEAFDSSASFSPTLPPDPANPKVPMAGLGRRGDVGVNSTSFSAGNLGILLASGSTVHGQLRAGVGSPNWNAVMTVNGTQDNLEDPANLRVVSEEATQVPRFVLGTDSAVSGFAFPHNLVTQELDQLSPPPTPMPTPGVTFMASSAASPAPGGTLINNTKSPGSPETPAPEPQRTGYDELRILNPGFYDMRSQGGTVQIEDVVLRSGARYHILGDVTFAGRVNVAYYDPRTGTMVDPEEGPLPTVLYIDGNVNFEPGTRFNMDWTDEDRDDDKDEPLPPRRIQIYTSNDKGEQFLHDTHTVTVGGSAARSQVSAVFVGSNMKTVVDNTDMWGGIQGLDVRVVGGSHVYFDVKLWGTPLEGRGQVAVLLNTVQVYTPNTAPAPAPASTGSTAPASSPAYTSNYGSGYCSPLIPIHHEELCYAY